MYLCEMRKSFIKIPTLILLSEVINIDFWQIWYFHAKGTGWLGLEFSIIFMRTLGRFDM